MQSKQVLAVGDAGYTILVDKDWYLQQYPDVNNASADPVDHYRNCGTIEGRLPRDIGFRQPLAMGDASLSIDLNRDYTSFLIEQAEIVGNWEYIDKVTNSNQKLNTRGTRVVVSRLITLNEPIKAIEHLSKLEVNLDKIGGFISYLAILADLASLGIRFSDNLEYKKLFLGFWHNASRLDTQLSKALFLSELAKKQIVGASIEQCVAMIPMARRRGDIHLLCSILLKASLVKKETINDIDACHLIEQSIIDVCKSHSRSHRNHLNILFRCFSTLVIDEKLYSNLVSAALNNLPRNQIISEKEFLIDIVNTSILDRTYSLINKIHIWLYILNENKGHGRDSRQLSENILKASKILEKLQKVDLPRELAASLRSLGHHYDGTRDTFIAINLFESALKIATIENSDLVEYSEAIKIYHVKRLLEANQESEARNFASKFQLDKINVRFFDVLTSKEFASKVESCFHIIKTSQIIDIPELLFFNEVPRLTAQRGNLVSNEFYCCRIESCMAVSESNLVIAQNYVVSDIARTTSSKEIVLGGVNKQTNRSLFIAHSQDTAIIELPEVTGEMLPEGISLMGVQSKNWGHWLAEYLPRIIAYNQIPATHCLPIYLDANLPKSAKDSLKLLDSYDRQVVEIDNEGAVRFEALWISNTVSYFPFDFVMPPEIDTLWPKFPFQDLVGDIKSKIKAKGGLNTYKRRRIYISRSNYSTRSITNEKEVRNYLEKLGFLTAHPEEMTFEEQVELFDSADIVVGTCNSALQNCIFCRPETKIFGLVHDYSGFNFHAYASFVTSGGASITFIRGKSLGENNVPSYHQKFHINVSDLNRSFQEWEAKYFSGILEKFDVDSSSQIEIIYNSFLFDENYYIKFFADKSLSRRDLVAYYIDRGWAEDLDCSVFFKNSYYTNKYQDIASMRINPLLHFLEWGLNEGRSPLDFSSLDKFSIDMLSTYMISDNVARALWLGAQVYNNNIISAAEELSRYKYAPGSLQMVLAAIYQLIQEYEFAAALHALRLIAEFYPEDANIIYQAAFACRSLGKLNMAKTYLAAAYNIDNSDTYRKELEVLNNHIITFADFEIDFEERRPISDLVFFDTSFPDPISSFRYGEFLAYTNEFPEARFISSNWDVQQYGGKKSFLETIRSDGKIRRNTDIVPFDSRFVSKGSNVYCVFLNNALIASQSETFRPEKFAFTLYPGGGFEINNPVSMRKLRKIFDDERLAMVITTQNITRRFLLDQNLCEPNKILHIYGGVVPFIQDGLVNVDGPTPSTDGNLRVCFVAQKYSLFGREKGFDIFIDVVNAMCDIRDIEFHVVGGFDREVLPVRDSANVTFHGVQPPEFFNSFYSRMNVIVSPNISTYELTGTGSFDGFPTTACIEASCRGAVMMIADSLDQNKDEYGNPIFHVGEEFIKIGRNPHEIVEHLRYFMHAREDLRRIGERGRKKLISLYSYKKQISRRVKGIRAAFKV